MDNKPQETRQDFTKVTLPSGAEVTIGDSTQVHTQGRDIYGRDVGGWIDVGGKLRPHP